MHKICDCDDSIISWSRLNRCFDIASELCVYYGFVSHYVICKLTEKSSRGRQEIGWTIWGRSVPQIWVRSIEPDRRRSYSTSRIWRLRSSQRCGIIRRQKSKLFLAGPYMQKGTHHDMSQNRYCVKDCSCSSMLLSSSDIVPMHEEE